MITNELISEIKSKINDNHKQDITGGLLQGVLVDMVKSLCEVYPHTYTDEEKAQARENIDALSNHNGEITKEKLSLEVQAILNDVANKQNISDATLATIAKTIVGAINEVYKGGLEDASIATSKIKDGAVTDAKIANGAVTTPKIANDAVTTEKVNDGAITEPKLDTDLVNIITSAVQPAELASAIATALTSYVAKADIVDTTGSATDKVMSQHGVTEAIDGVTNKVTELDKKSQGVLYEDLNGKTSKNLIDSNTVWTDGKYVNTISGELSSYNSLSVTDFIPVSSGRIIFYTYSEDILNGGQALAIYDSSKRTTIYDSLSSPYFSSLQHIEGYIYSVDLPANAAYVRINVKTTEKSLAFINFVYNSDTKLSLSWLLLQDGQIPQILPNKIFSDNFIFEQEEYIVQNYTEGGFISCPDDAGRNIDIIRNNDIHSAIIPCQEGDILVVKNGSFILPTDTNFRNYYAFGQISNPMISAVSLDDMKQNYISVFNESEKTFLVKVPSGCGYFYLTMGDNDRADDNVKFCIIKQKLKWLEISQDNMSQEAVSAIISSTISNQSFSTSVANISENSQQTREAEYHLWDSICKKIEFNGKVIKFFGDSITAGVCSPNLGNAGNDRYSSMFCRLVGANEQNYGIGGSCITDSQEGDQYNIGTRVKQFVQSTDQIIIIAGGTNDFNQGKTIGTFGDTQRTTFYGSLNDICSHIKTTAPDAVVIFITPIPYTKPESEYPYHIASLNEYRSAIYDVATKYGYNVVDGNSIGMPKMQGGWNNFMCDDSDGCHPTIEGHKLMARNLCGKLL